MRATVIQTVPLQPLGADIDRMWATVIQTVPLQPPGADIVWPDMIQCAEESGGRLRLVVIHFPRGVPEHGGREELIAGLIKT
jgi:hypothetical protein